MSGRQSSRPDHILSGAGVGESRAKASLDPPTVGAFRLQLMSSAVLSIGDFARATQMSVKMLRHYHELGLLEPADVDANTGYRRYTTDQIPAAQVIRRFRALDMPLDRIKTVLAAPDLAERNRLISAHLSSMQETLAQTQAAVASLQNLLHSDPSAPADTISIRKVPATAAAAITATVDVADLAVWYQGAFGELHGTLAAHGVAASGHAGGIYDGALFAHERGEATVFIPCASDVRAAGRVQLTEIPSAELAIIEHAGPHDDIDRAYGALAAYVARHAIGVDGPIREYYPVSNHETADPAAWRTEVGWPIFGTRGND
jgi:DNA-binding transcriptional MerR regulator